MKFQMIEDEKIFRNIVFSIKTSCLHILNIYYTALTFLHAKNIL